LPRNLQNDGDHILEDKFIRHREEKLAGLKGLTLMEMVIAMAIITVIFASILPLFRNVQAGWDVRRGTSEALQNGFALSEHIKRNLTKATKIIDVSDPGDTNGYIEYHAEERFTYRYELDMSTKYVTFGAVDDLSELAGPVSSLNFTCYAVSQDDNNLSSPISDLGANVELTRFVEVAAIVTDPEQTAVEKNFKIGVYILVNGNSSAPLHKEPDSSFELDVTSCANSELMQIDSTHYLCVYTGFGKDGWAAVLQVDTAGWTVGKSAPFEFDENKCATPALSKIDTYKYLCAYSGKNDNGYAVMLTVDPSDWTITKDISLTFDNQNGQYPSLYRINDTHHLCVYQGKHDDGFAVVLTVNGTTGEVSAETPLEFDTRDCHTPALSQVDPTHYLCVYEGSQNDGYAVVLTVNTTSWEIIAETPFKYDTVAGKTPSLSRIDSEHYLCAYAGVSNNGYAVVLTVNTVNWEITSAPPLIYNTNKVCSPDLARIENGTFLCVYEGPSVDAWGNILTVNTDDWTVSTGTAVEYDPVGGKTPSLAGINADHYLCVYQGGNNDGWSCILNVNPPILP